MLDRIMRENKDPSNVTVDSFHVKGGLRKGFENIIVS
jgi:hypothetical protein